MRSSAKRRSPRRRASLLSRCAVLRAQSCASRASSSIDEALRARGGAARRSSTRARADASPADAAAATRRATLIGAYEDMSRLFPAQRLQRQRALAGRRARGRRVLAVRRRARSRRRRCALLRRRWRRASRPARWRSRSPRSARRLAATRGRPRRRPRAGWPRPRRRHAPPHRRLPRSAACADARIRREVLPDALRITLELDREVPFYDERHRRPAARVRRSAEHARGRGAQGRDARRSPTTSCGRCASAASRTRARASCSTCSGAARYSVYTLYNPYRIVIDFERARARAEPAAPATAATRATARRAPATPTVSAASRDRRDRRSVAAAATGRAAERRRRLLAVAPARARRRAHRDRSRPWRPRSRRARCTGSNEAELVLDVALRLEKLLLKQPGVEVVLTRRTNAFVAARGAHGDRQPRRRRSVPVDSRQRQRRRAARGVETYFLNFAPNPEAEAIAARENAGSRRTMRSLPDIVQGDRAQQQDRRVARLRVDGPGVAVRAAAAGRTSSARNLGVKQAPFMVLIGATMPSVLAEISFMTNRQEATLLKTAKYRAADRRGAAHGRHEVSAGR